MTNRITIRPAFGKPLALTTRWFLGWNVEEGDGPIPNLGPTSAIVDLSKQSGEVLFAVTGLAVGEIISSISPNNGVIVASANGRAVVRGTAAGANGIIVYTITTTTGRTLSVSVMAEGESGETNYRLDFSRSVYETPMGTVADLVDEGLLVATRPSEFLALNSSGSYQRFPAGVIPITDLGIWRRGQTRTNAIPNNTMAGASIGSPGVLPNTWAMGNLAAGVTREIVGFGQSSPDKGLPYIDIRVRGTATANSSTYMAMASAIADATGNNHVFSCFISVIDGEIPSHPVSGNATLRPYIGFNGTGGSNMFGPPVMNRDVQAKRHKLARRNPATGNPTLGAGLLFAIRTGMTYDFTIRIQAPQLELVSSLSQDASAPILTSSGAVTATKDKYEVSGDLLSYLGSGSGCMELTTTNLRGSGLDFRTVENILLFNGSIAALKRTEDGRIASDLPGSPMTYKSWRTQFGWEKKHALSWSPTGCQVASTSPRHASSVRSGSQPSITAIELDFDGCLKSLECTNRPIESVDPYTTINTDVLIYGATSGGIVAASQSAKLGDSVAVVGGWRECVPGGMATGGLGRVDASNVDAFGGMSRDYLTYCNEYDARADRNSLTITSNTAARFFEYMIEKYKIDMHWVKGVTTSQKDARKRGYGASFTLGQRSTFKGWVDCSYEGDFMASMGCTFVTGREQRNVGVDFNGDCSRDAGQTNAAGLSEHQFTPYTGGPEHSIITIDPYVIPGDPSSGLVRGVQRTSRGPTAGAPDDGHQAYNFRQTLTTLASQRVPIAVEGSPPMYYDPENYELLGRWLAGLTALGWTCVSHEVTPNRDNMEYNIGLFFIPSLLGGVYDFNANNGFSSDAFGSNWGVEWARIMSEHGISNPSASYSLASYEEREIYWKWLEGFIRGYWYWLAFSGDSRIPAQLRTTATTFGLCNDYYLDHHENDEPNWMTGMYVREARRLRGMLIMESSDVKAADGTIPRGHPIAALSYPVDSHHVSRFVDTSTGVPRVINEGNMFDILAGDKISPVAAEYITPVKADCTNGFVCFAASAKHTGFGALRMEIAHMASAQSAAIMMHQVINRPEQPDVQDWILNNYESHIRPGILAEGQVAPLVN